MKKTLLLSFFILISTIGSLYADSNRTFDDPGLSAVYSYFSCNYQIIKKSETERALDGKYQKSVTDLMTAKNKIPPNNCFFKVTKKILKKYSTETTSANDFLYGAMYMTNIYALAAHNFEALKVTGKGHKPEVGEIHVLPGGYAKEFTASGKWEEYYR